MTREEAKKQLWSFGNINTLSKVECDELINQIYDDFESRTCESCSWFSEDENGYVCNKEHMIYNYSDIRQDGYLSPDKDFGCNQWEAKD